jgi:hypothetical protein
MRPRLRSQRPEYVRGKRDQFPRVSASAASVRGPANIQPRVAAVGPAQLLETVRERCEVGLPIRTVRSGIHEGANPLHALGLANLFLHYAFDMWMARTCPLIPFERYADDAICHCKSAEEAQALWSALADRYALTKVIHTSSHLSYSQEARHLGTHALIGALPR